MLVSAYIDALQVHKTATLALSAAGGLLDEPEPRSSVVSRQRRHGSIVHASFYDGRVLDLAGIARGETSEEALAAVEELKAATRLGSAHTFRFQILGSTLEEELDVVFVSRLELVPKSLRSYAWAVQAVAADPRRYSTTLSESGYDPTAAGGAARGLTFPLRFPLVFAGEAVTNLSVENSGDFPTPPVFTILGPVTDPVIDNDTTGESIYTQGLSLAAGETAVLDVAARELLVGAGGGTGGDTYSERILEAAPLAYYRLEESALLDGLVDSSSHSRPASPWVGAGITFSQPAATTDAGSSVELAGASAHPTAADLYFEGLLPFTVEAWIRPLVSEAFYRRLLSTEWSDGSGLQGYAISVRSNGSLQMQRFRDGANNTLTAAASLPLGSWSHVAFVFDGSTYLALVNGVVVGSLTPAGAVLRSLKSGGPGTVGVFERLSDGGIKLNGGADELAVYDRALTESELLEHYELGLSGAAPPAPFTGQDRPDLILARLSSWFELEPGENRLRLRGDDMAAGETELRVQWRDARL